MKLKPNADIPTFLKAVQACRANVRFTTADGDELDLKSTLCQYVFTAVCTDDLRDLKGTIQVEDPQDVALLAEYLMPAM